MDHFPKTALFGVLVAGSLTICLAASPVAAQGDSPELLINKTRQWQLPYTPVDMVQSVDGKYIFVLTDNNKLLIYEPNGNLKASAEVDPGVVAIDTDARGEQILLVDKDNKTFTSFSIDFVAEVDVAGSPFKGNPDAPVTVAVFSDFE
jgi:hypothetical protein